MCLLLIALAMWKGPGIQYPIPYICNSIILGTNFQKSLLVLLMILYCKIKKYALLISKFQLIQHAKSLPGPVSWYCTVKSRNMLYWFQNFNSSSMQNLSPGLSHKHTYIQYYASLKIALPDSNNCSEVTMTFMQWSHNLS